MKISRTMQGVIQVWWPGAESNQGPGCLTLLKTKAYFIRSESTFLRFEPSSPCAKFHKLSDVEY